MTDWTPRYAPNRVMMLRGNAFGMAEVIAYHVFPPHSHPQSPILNGSTAVELVTVHGSRWFGFERAYINSELRLVCAGFDSRDEVRRKWEVCEVTA